jgi:hypothetical protein
MNEMTTTQEEIRSLPEAESDVQAALLLWAKQKGLDPATLTWGDLQHLLDAEW